MEKVLAYVDSDSLSEAIFTALEQCVELKEKRKKNRMKRHAAKTKGIWADDPDIEKALEEIEKRWETWETVEFGALQAQRESDLQDLLFII